MVRKVAVEALECGHVFHEECLGRAMDATGKSKRELCPFRCHQSVVPVPDASETTAHLVDVD